MADFSRFRALAKRLISKNGIGFEIVRDVEGTYDPVTDVETPAEPERYPGTAVIFPTARGDEYRFGTVIPTGSVRIMIPAEALGTVVKVGDAFEFPDGQRFRAEAVATTGPDLTPIVFDVLGVTP